MVTKDPEYTTPAAVRAVTSYPARRSFKPGAIDPSTGIVVGVADTVDIHCHASKGQQDPLGVAKLASRSGMRGILYKTITDRKAPAKRAREVQQDLNAWAEKEGIAPITCWAGSTICEGFLKPIRVERSRELLDDGCVSLWMPNTTSARTLSVVGAHKIHWDKTADPEDHSDPLPWDEALKYGDYLLDAKGALKADIQEIFRMSADRGTAIFMGHPTKPELWAMAEFSYKLGFKRGVVDHPFSPFVGLSIPEMKEIADLGLWMNFTFDEISPLLGIDPQLMYDAVRAVGPERCTLSSDCGEPLFPNSVEAMRMMNYYMMAFGCSAEEIRIMTVRNPLFIVGAEDRLPARAAAE
jgi:hypothetical protein